MLLKRAASCPTPYHSFLYLIPVFRQFRRLPGFHTLFFLFGVSMGFVERLRVGQECAEAGVCTEIDFPPAIFCVREVSRIGVVEYPSAECDELLMALLFTRKFRHFVCHFVISILALQPA